MTIYAKELIELAKRSNGLLVLDYVEDQVWALAAAKDDNITIHYRGDFKNTKPWTVKWKTSGDKKIKGKWKSVDYYRTRSFKYQESLLKFVKEMI